MARLRTKRRVLDENQQQQSSAFGQQKNHTCTVLNLTPLYFLCLVRADYDCTAAV